MKLATVTKSTKKHEGIAPREVTFFCPHSKGMTAAYSNIVWASKYLHDKMGIDVKVDRQLCVGEWDYAVNLIDIWQSYGTLFIIEHDIFPSGQMLMEMLTCKEQICVAGYTLYPASTLLGEPVRAHRIVTKWASGPEFKWVEEGDEWCDYFATGCIKFKAEVRASMGITDDTDPVSWKGVDVWLSQLMRRNGRTKRAHIHWPEVEHKHELPRGEREESLYNAKYHKWNT